MAEKVKREKNGKKGPGWLERQLGVEVYRIVKGLMTNPISVAGMVLLGVFLFVALAAPILAPPLHAD